MLMTKTPFRVSFFGGGTDYYDYYANYGGCVLSTTIDKYCYLSMRDLPPMFNYKSQFTYSRIERFNSPDEVSHPLVRAALHFIPIERLQLAYDADLPAASGIGSSSAFAVGLLQGLHAMKNEYPDRMTLAKEAISDIISRGKRPVLVGGTGFYIESLISGVEFAKAEGDPKFRASLFKKAETLGVDALYEELKKADPESAKSIHPNNIKRVVRALELLSVTGKTKTELNALSKENANPLDCDVIYLSYENRDELYAKINARVDKMFDDGLEDEVYSLWKDGLEQTPTASQAIGYKEFFPYFKGDLTLADVKETIKQATRNYAKRQETYFNRMAKIYGNIKKTEPENPK